MIIDTSDIIDTKEKLKLTKRYACFIDEDSNSELIGNSELNKDIFKILDEKRRKDNSVCLVDLAENHPKILEPKVIRNAIFVMVNSSLSF